MNDHHLSRDVGRRVNPWWSLCGLAALRGVVGGAVRWLLDFARDVALSA